VRELAPPHPIFKLAIHSPAVNPGKYQIFHEVYYQKPFGSLANQIPNRIPGALSGPRRPGWLLESPLDVAASRRDHLSIYRAVTIALPETSHFV